ncbi:MAG: T9SS type A sorting domain-containing protein [Ignavibacteriaceae bacterium]
MILTVLNPSTVIKYNIPESGFVIIKVFDVLGNEVMNLVNEKKETGSYEVSLNLSNLPSGLYLYQLKVNGFVETRKMMLMK